MTTPAGHSSRITTEQELDLDRPATARHVEHTETVPEHRHPLPPQPAPTVNVPTERHELVRWGAVVAGTVVALATFLLIEIGFFALGWLTPGDNEAGIGRAIVTGLIGLFAFFLGGLTASATARWNGARSGILHGIMVWAFGLVALILLALLGGGALLGPAADVLTQSTDLFTSAPDANVTQAVQTARDASADAALGLGLAWAAAVIGGLVGTKMWNGTEQDETHR